MNIIIIQECGRHEANKNYRESLNLQRALSKNNDIEAIVWGLNYPNFSTPFSEIEKWADVIFVIENYTPEWLPVKEIKESKKLKIYWSIDSHMVLNEHKKLCSLLDINILLNSTEDYLTQFNGLVDNSYWFPNAYPDDLIFPMEIEKKYDIGFCGNQLNRGHFIDHLNKFNIKKDFFVIGDEMVRSINSYKIHFNRNISNDINYRTFETTGCKTFLLTNYTAGLEKLFKIGEEIVVYDNFNDLDEKVQYYLNNETERKKIELAGYERSKKEHTYYERSKMLLDIIKNRI
jgi:spore maturation protein CgeB